MPSVPVLGGKGKSKETLELSANVFGVSVRVPLLHQAVVRELAARRRVRVEAAEIEPDPGREADWRSTLNRNSVEVIKSARLEPGLASALPEERFQFERLGYFCVDRRDAALNHPVFNRTVTLKDSWVKESQGG